MVDGNLPGRAGFLQVVDPNHYFQVAGVPVTFPTSAQGAAQAGGAPGAPEATPAAVAGQIAGDVVEENFNTGQDWFERVHIFPDDSADNPNRLQGHVIEFGNVLAQEEEDYEVYSAYRHDEVTLTTVDPSAVSPGIETPDVTTPLVVTPQTSILAPSSTFNTNGTTGLGTLVKVEVRALSEGLPRFDGAVLFTFSSGDVVALLVTGDRIVLLTPQFEAPLDELMSFLTELIPARTGREQRISLRKQPREGWVLDYRLAEEEAQRMRNTLFGWAPNLFGLPLWHERVELTAATSPGATVFPISGGDDVDFRVGGLAAVLTDALTFDVLNLTAVTDTQLTADSPSANGYPAGTPVLPVRIVRLAALPRGSRHLVNLESVQLTFESVDNDTGAPAAGTSWNPNTYNGRVLLDECNVSEENPQEFVQVLVVIDNATGVVTQSSPWDRSQRVHQKGFSALSRAEVRTLKAMLRTLRGRQVAFYIPSFTEDLTVVANIGSGTLTLDVAHVSYVRFAQQRDPKRIFRITFTDGSSLVREVVSSIQLGSAERLTLNTTWPANRTVDEVERVQFYELVRFDTDRFRIRIPEVGQAEVRAPVRAVFDDDV